ncbi:SDR family NAD(P)-dependent oxidoreductase [Amycolatopsis methanolica]|uniref:Short-chain dehydrogenase/reductase SDR n=1 Tax=Amycolatopsis methanolica 239 TaxID=1068978 RepID=A0A076MXI8_AMYME|nr:SDR family NAD(P)-dependent oxidoreductase [Amycolatopsis methanolica]AIJ25704.1 Short-chain dehydrogenase/reductase SDR [Amycolatopsis methanolica 239]
MTNTGTRPLAVVTGASTGIGRELAKQFASHGYDLVIAAENAELDHAQRELLALGAQVLGVRGDLASYDGVENLVAAVASVDRPLAALAVNAGVGVGGAFVDGSLRDELNVVHLNVTSAVHLARRLLPGMVEQAAGRVLFTSSVAAMTPGPFQAVYSASKAFLASFAEALREELKDSGVTVTALLPGPTDTEFFERAGMTDTKIAQGPKDDPAEVAEQGFAAMMAGKDKVVAGSARNKVQAAAARAVPDTVKAAMHRRMAQPGSAGQS